MNDEADSTTSPHPSGVTPGRGVGPGRGPQRLHRSRGGRMVAGVADGLADYLDVDTTLVRVAFVVFALVGGIALPLYLAGWLLIPEEGSERSVAEGLLGRHPAL